MGRRGLFRLCAAWAASRAGVAPSAFKAAGASDSVTVGIIGAGSHGTYLMEELERQGCRTAALCDVYEKRLDWALARCRSVPTPLRTKYYEKVLDMKEVDAVVNATPEHWHHDILLAAVRAEKDVYTEKPLAASIEQANALVEAVNRSKCVVQVGHQRRSGEHWKRARHVITSGTLGEITWIRVFDTRWWVKHDPFANRTVDPSLIDWKRFLGSAPSVPLDPYRYWAWRWFWNFAGGLLTDIGSHLFDLVNWLTDTLGPKTVTANGGVYYFKRWETPDVVHAVLDYGFFSVLFSAGFTNRYEGAGARFYGTEGTLVITRDEFKVLKESQGSAEKQIASWPRTYETPSHVANWLECIRTRRLPNASVETARNAVNTAHAANLSYRKGLRIRWSPEEQKALKK